MKNTAEAYNTMLLEDARQVAAQIRKRFDVQRILLFGSGARGEARESSDLDILVIGESELSYKERRYALYGEVNPPRDTDLFWYTPGELAGMRHSGNSFIRHAMNTVFEL